MDNDPNDDFFEEVLVMCYIEKLSKDKIGYSRRKSVYLLRNKAIKRFETMMYGFAIDYI